MRTSKPFSTISYNSIDFLTKKLVELTDSGKVDFWSFIKHRAEEDEKKDHIHLIVYPSSLTDTNSFIRLFIQFVDDEKSPRVMRPCQSSKFTDWFLYTLHHSGYLALKGQSRKYHYTLEDFVCSDDVFMQDLIHQIDWTKINPLGDVIEAAESGMSFREFLARSNLSLLQVRSAQFVFETIQGKNILERNGRLTHTPK